MLQAVMTPLDAILTLVSAILLAFVWYMVGRSGSRSYWQGYLRGYDNGYDTGRKDGFEEGHTARDQAWWDQLEAQVSGPNLGQHKIEEEEEEEEENP
jgi:hypothetical protein